MTQGIGRVHARYGRAETIDGLAKNRDSAELFSQLSAEPVEGRRCVVLVAGDEEHRHIMLPSKKVDQKDHLELLEAVRKGDNGLCWNPFVLFGLFRYWAIKNTACQLLEALAPATGVAAAQIQQLAKKDTRLLFALAALVTKEAISSRLAHDLLILACLGIFTDSEIKAVLPAHDLVDLEKMDAILGSREFPSIQALRNACQEHMVEVEAQRAALAAQNRAAESTLTDKTPAELAHILQESLAAATAAEEARQPLQAFAARERALTAASELASAAYKRLYDLTPAGKARSGGADQAYEDFNRWSQQTADLAEANGRWRKAITIRTRMAEASRRMGQIERAIAILDGLARDQASPEVLQRRLPKAALAARYDAASAFCEPQLDVHSAPVEPAAPVSPEVEQEATRALSQLEAEQRRVLQSVGPEQFLCQLGELLKSQAENMSNSGDHRRAAEFFLQAANRFMAAAQRSQSQVTREQATFLFNRARSELAAAGHGDSADYRGFLADFARILEDLAVHCTDAGQRRSYYSMAARLQEELAELLVGDPAAAGLAWKKARDLYFLAEDKQKERELEGKLWELDLDGPKKRAERAVKLADFAGGSGDLYTARSWLERARDAWHELGYHRHEAQCIEKLAALDESLNHSEEAIDGRSLALVLKRGWEDDPSEEPIITTAKMSLGYQALEFLAERYEHAGRWKQAARVHGLIVARAALEGEKAKQIQHLEKEAEIYEKAEDIAESKRTLEGLFRLYQDADRHQDVGKTWLRLFKLVPLVSWSEGTRLRSACADWLSATPDRSQYLQEQLVAFREHREANSTILLQVAWMLFEGRGLPENKEEAVAIHLYLAAQGLAKAQCNLGYAYWAGCGVGQDDAEAVKWYRLAAEQGLAEAQGWLGVAYWHGRGVGQDDAEAVKWYRLAAAQGIAEAQCNLGHAYGTGRGVGRDDAEAVKWYRLAAAQGIAEARRILREDFREAWD